MKDDLRSPVQHALVLHRIEPHTRMARFYALMIEHDLFGHITLVRHWGRIGTLGRSLTQTFPSEHDAAQALQSLAAAKRKRGYKDL